MDIILIRISRISFSRYPSRPLPKWLTGVSIFLLSGSIALCMKSNFWNALGPTIRALRNPLLHYVTARRKGSVLTFAFRWVLYWLRWEVLAQGQNYPRWLFRFGVFPISLPIIIEFSWKSLYYGKSYPMKACSGCVTSAETVLITQQSLEEFTSVCAKGPGSRTFSCIFSQYYF